MKRHTRDAGIKTDDAQGPGRGDDGRGQDTARPRVTLMSRGGRGRVRQNVSGQDAGNGSPDSFNDCAIRAHPGRASGLTIPVRGEGWLRAWTIEQQDAAVLSGNRLENRLQKLLCNLLSAADRLNAGTGPEQRGQGAPGPGLSGGSFRRGCRHQVRAVQPLGLNAVSGMLRPATNGS